MIYFIFFNNNKNDIGNCFLKDKRVQLFILFFLNLLK